ncbi:molybdopterin-dependent oxidoreductase [Shimia sp. Alg240-R146]|uniref:molybdopterin-dependent oxidoreductase n=1 Tax=Shimia sp. Alg240-R146 TaxID=2993449 RepID=UPI0022E886C3|nr:molybdopterin-dependent oxidoreductase [Shimia sp. Alg240-R146]
MTFVFRTAVSFVFCLLLPLTTAFAADDVPAAPTGSVILTVSGKIGAKNAEGTVQFDIDMLRALPAETVSTSTIWTEGVHVFTGVPLALLLDELGSSSSTLRALAINDYAIELPVSELQDKAPILAYEMNGEPMHRRDKGPLWIIYPYDSSAEYQTSLVYSRSVWQLDRLELVD